MGLFAARSYRVYLFYVCKTLQYKTHLSVSLFSVSPVSLNCVFISIRTRYAAVPATAAPSSAWCYATFMLLAAHSLEELYATPTTVVTTYKAIMLLHKKEFPTILDEGASPSREMCSQNCYPYCRVHVAGRPETRNHSSRAYAGRYSFRSVSLLL